MTSEAINMRDFVEPLEAAEIRRNVRNQPRPGAISLNLHFPFKSDHSLDSMDAFLDNRTVDDSPTQTVQ